MAKGLVINHGVDLDANWLDRMVIDSVPVAIPPTNFAGALAVGGALGQATFFYVVTAVGINGESEVNTAELSFTTNPVQQRVNLTWDAQKYVTKYRVYRGTATGVYDGYIEVGTNSLADIGDPLAFNSLVTVPPATNPITGVTTTYAPIGTWTAERSFLFFSEITVHGYTFIPAFNDGVDNVPEKSVLHLVKNRCMQFDIDMSQVLYPTNWNTPGSDAGVLQAIDDIQAWAEV